MGVYQSAIYCIDLLAGIWCWTESTNDRCKIPIYRIFSYRDDSLVLLLRCICINYGCFREYTYLVKKVVFNIRILPTTKILSNLYTHLFFILIGIAVALINGIYPSAMSLQLIYYLFCMCAFLTGLTWLTASIQPFLPDIMQLITIVLQLIMWTLPILWSPNQFDSGLVSILKLNPLYYVVQGYRESFLSEAWFWEHGTYTLYFWVFTLVMFVIGSAVFRRLKPHFSDVL